MRGGAGSAGHGDERVAKPDLAQAGVAVQLAARDLRRGHGESLRVRVRGTPEVPVGPGPGPRRARNLPGVWPRLGAAARSLEPALLRARLGGRADRPALGGALGPARSLVGMCLLSHLQLLPNPTGESRESELAPGSGAEGSEGRRARGGVGAGGGRTAAGSAEPAAESRAPRTPRPWAREACPGMEPPLGAEG